MTTISIRSKRGLPKVCGVIINEKWTPVDATEFARYRQTRMGKIIVDEYIEIFTDHKSSKVMESAEVSALKDTRATDKKRIKRLEVENSDLKADLKKAQERIEKLDLIIKDLSIPGPTDAPPAPDKEVSEDDTEFIFDPEKHTLEHKGNGKYVVMDEMDVQVHVPTSDEKDAFKAMIAGD